MLDNVEKSGSEGRTAPCSPTGATSKGGRKWDKVRVGDKWPGTAGLGMKWSGTGATKNDGVLFSHALTATYGRHSLPLTRGRCGVSCRLAKKKAVIAIKC